MTAIIRVANVSKQYRLGTPQQGFSNLREALSGAVRAPFGRNRSNGARNNEQIFWALKDVSFEVAEGEVLGIIGRNGAGKSTLLKILSRITEPSTGRIELFGRVGSLLEVGTGFHPELTGRENIYLNGAILGMKRDEIDKKFDEIVAFAELEKFLDTPVKRYSSGMYVRLAFAVAAHLESEILIVDEVLAVGDVKFQKKCLGKMGDITNEGRTILIVTHNVGIVSSLCTKALYLSEGSVRAHGQPDQVVNTYLSETFGNTSHSLDRLRLPGMGADVRFLDIRLLGSDGGNIPFGQPLEFVLTVGADRDVDALTIGSSVFNALGTPVGSLITREEFSIKAGTVNVLRLRLGNSNLAPGSYYAGFSLGRGGRGAVRSDLDSLIGTPAFQVVPIANTDDPIANWHLNWGSVVFKDTILTFEETASPE